MKKQIRPPTSQKRAVKTGSQRYDLPPWLQAAIDDEIQNLKPQRLAECIQKQADFYAQSPQAPTPWREAWCQTAQLAYYFPLNWIRAHSVVGEAARLGFFDGLEFYTDWGSGLGPLSLELSHYIESGECIETSEIARETHRKLFRAGGGLAEPKFNSKPSSTRKGLFAASYSLTELAEIPRELFESEAVLVIEPSTREDGRALLKLRDQLIAKGFHIWAPCLHQGKCPLLTHSEKDWCHDRVHVKLPPWLTAAEKFLPFRNQTVTFSYVCARRTPPPTSAPGSLRVVGDLLRERGKSRQLICRGESREYLSWMHKLTGEPVSEIARGSLLSLGDSTLEKKSDELRLTIDQAQFLESLE